MTMEGNVRKSDISHETPANDNEQLSRTERLAYIKKGIQEKGGVKSALLDGMQRSFNWVAAHKELFKQDVSIVLNKISDSLSRVPEYAYNKYRAFKREERFPVLTGSIDEIVKAYFGAKQLARWGHAFAIRRAQEIKSLHEHGGNVVRTTVEFFKAANELSKRHREERAQQRTEVIEKSLQDWEAMLAFLGSNDNLGLEIAEIANRRRIVGTQLTAAEELKRLMEDEVEANTNDSISSIAA